MRLHLWQKALSGKRHQMATAVPQRSYIQFSVLGWSPLLDMKDTGWHIYANFCISSHAFWKTLVSFLHWKHMSALHPLFPLNPNSCFLANLLVNLKVFHPFSHNWCSDPVIIRGTTLQITFSAQRWIKQSCALAKAFLGSIWLCEPIETGAPKATASYILNALSVYQNTEGSFYQGLLSSKSMKRQEGVGYHCC